MANKEQQEFVCDVLVEHPALGLGRIVVMQPDAVHVYFRDKGGQCATKLKMADAKKLLRIAPVQSNEWLDHLPPFRFDSKQNRYCLKHERLSHGQAVAKFLSTFPGGFSDPKYLGTLKEGERVYKDHFAHQYRELLMNGEGERLLQAGALDELRHRLLSVAKINLLHFKWDLAALRDGLSGDDEVVRAFFAALLDASSAAPSESKFNALAKALNRLPAPGSPVASWPMATVFPYLARPDEHMFFRPTPTREASDRLAFELNYKSDLNWLTYSSVLAFSKWLLGQLRQYGAKDFIDVQSFVFVTWIPDYTT